MPSAVELTFEVECSETKPGDAVFIVGSTDVLGAWDPSKACACSTSKLEFPKWTSETLRLPGDASKLEFKMLVMPARGKPCNRVRWEDGANRVLHLKTAGGQSHLVASCTWGKPEVRVQLRPGGPPGVPLGGGQLAPAKPAAPPSPVALAQPAPEASPPPSPPAQPAPEAEPPPEVILTKAPKADVPSPWSQVLNIFSPAERSLEQPPRLAAAKASPPCAEDTLGELRPSTEFAPMPMKRRPSALVVGYEGLPFQRQASGDNALTPAMQFSRQSSGESMSRRSSRHIVFNADGSHNAQLSRNPSMMLLDMAELEEEIQKHDQEIEEMERERLNRMQRRIQSGSLLEEMRKITDHADPNTTVLLQGFNWESWRAGAGDWYGLLDSKVDIMEELGVTDVWLPPCSQSVAAQGYLPSQLFNLDGSKYGTQAALEGLLKKLHDKGIRGVADIVINHRCGDQQDSQGRWNQFSSGMTSRPSFAGVMEWGGWAITLGDRFSDGTGEHGPGHYDGKFDAAPDIDHKNQKVQASISVWLRWLRLQVGFDAWRFDFVKGYAAEFVSLYCKKSEPAWAVGELWTDMQYDDKGLCHNQDKHRQDLCNWVNATDKTSTAFDFTTKGILQEACRNCQYWRLRDQNGKPPGLLGWMPKHAVTFIDNHDTGSTQRHWPFPDDKVLVGYAYIITHPGIPCLFWDHVMDWGEDHRRKIVALLKARRESGIPADAPVNIQRADHDLYLAEVGRPPALRVALGPRGAGDPDRNYWSECAAGRDYKVWVHRALGKEEPIRLREQPKVKAKEPTMAAPKAAPPPAEKPAPVAFDKASQAQDRMGRSEFAEQFGRAAVGQQAPSVPRLAEITVEGTSISLGALREMAVADLERLGAHLDDALQVTKQVLASKKAASK